MPTRPELYAAAARLVGHVRELPGQDHHPFIQWGHSLCALGFNAADEVPWCSSGLNALCFMLGAPRSGSASARSWLKVGMSVPIAEAEPGDIVVFKRGDGIQPGPEVVHAPGHVAILGARWDGGPRVVVFGGNQSNAWTRAPFPVKDILDIRRITA